MTLPPRFRMHALLHRLLHDLVKRVGYSSATQPLATIAIATVHCLLSCSCLFLISSYPDWTLALELEISNPTLSQGDESLEADRCFLVCLRGIECCLGHEYRH